MGLPYVLGPLEGSLLRAFQFGKVCSIRRFASWTPRSLTESGFLAQSGEVSSRLIASARISLRTVTSFLSDSFAVILLLINLTNIQMLCSVRFSAMIDIIPPSFTNYSKRFYLILFIRNRQFYNFLCQIKGSVQNCRPSEN